jgi:hypothetical protein
MAKMNPWVPMSDPVDLKILGKLLEELGELSAAASRCLIQGANEAEPVTGKINSDWLAEEIADVKAGLLLTIQRFDLDRAKIDARMVIKYQGLHQWHKMVDK